MDEKSLVSLLSFFDTTSPGTHTHTHTPLRRQDGFTAHTKGEKIEAFLSTKLRSHAII